MSAPSGSASFGVKVALPTGMHEDTFLEKVQETLGAAYPRYSNVARTHDGLLFECGSEMARTRILSLSGLVHDDLTGMVKVEMATASLLDAGRILVVLDELVHGEDEIRLANPVTSP